MSDRDGIYHRPDSGCWWISYQDASGKTVRRSSKIRLSLDPHGDKAFALREEWIRKERPVPVVVSVDSMVWEQLVLDYVDVLKKRVRVSTLDTYAKAVKNLKRSFEGRMVEKITTREVKAHIREEQARGLSAASINLQVAFSGGMWRWAMDELEMSIVNVWDRRSLPVDNARERFLTREEAVRVIDAARQSPAKHLADWIEFALHTGLRTGEISSLTWSRVDLDAGIITLGREDQKSGRISALPLNATAHAVLQRRMERMKRSGVISPYCFWHRRGEQIADIRYPLATAVAKAGLGDVHPHDLRRTFASWLAQANVPIHVIAELLRHKDVNLTHRVYAHLSTDAMREAADVLNRPRLQIVK